MRRLDLERDHPWIGALLVSGASGYLLSSTDAQGLELDAFRALSSSSTVIGTVLFGFVSSTLAIFLSNDKNPIVVATRNSVTHKRRMLNFFKEALVASVVLVFLSVFFTAFNGWFCASGSLISTKCLLFLSIWFGAFAWISLSVWRVYYFIFNMLE